MARIELNIKVETGARSESIDQRARQAIDQAYSALGGKLLEAKYFPDFPGAKPVIVKEAPKQPTGL